MIALSSVALDLNLETNCRLPELDERQLATITWSFGSLKHNPGALLDLLAEAATPRLDSFELHVRSKTLPAASHTARLSDALALCIACWLKQECLHLRVRVAHNCAQGNSETMLPQNQHQISRPTRGTNVANVSPFGPLVAH